MSLCYLISFTWPEGQGSSGFPGPQDLGPKGATGATSPLWLRWVCDPAVATRAGPSRDRDPGRPGSRSRAAPRSRAVPDFIMCSDRACN